LLPRIITTVVNESNENSGGLRDVATIARQQCTSRSMPDPSEPFVGIVEIVCGVLVLAGLVTRFAAIPLLGIMAVALTTTKVPILLERGFWAMAHEARTDWSMTLGAVFLLIVGAGPWSVDARLSSRS
jgi:putative oxidoreductase